MNVPKGTLRCASFLKQAAARSLSTTTPTTLVTRQSSTATSHLASYAVPRQLAHDSILDVIGKTPVVKLQKLAPPDVNVYLKLECENPGGSVKDRLAYGIVEWAEKHGQLQPGQVRMY